MIGSIIENYKLVSVLGEGGMGIVYKAFDLKLERYVALKILSPHALLNPQFIARFKREAKNQAKLTHPNIVPVYGFTEDNHTFGIVMEYVEGETLEHLIKRKGHLSSNESLLILKQILLGIGYAHTKGFVHRDIKPSNVIINNEGSVKIMDFGISKSIHESKGITKTGTKLGTVLYMSPEQIKALEPTNQSDIYSIGITFYEMLSGKTPFEDGTEFEIMEAHLKKNPDKISSVLDNIPTQIDNIISKALNKSLVKRYQTCDDLLNDVDELLVGINNPSPNRKTKRKETTTETTNGRPSLGAKIRFYSMAFLFICLFGLLFYFVYITVSQFWKSSNENRGMNLATNSNEISNYKWKVIASPTSKSLNSICFINDSVGYSCGDQGIVIKTNDRGNSWIILNDSSSINLYDIKFLSTETGFIVGEKGTILKTNNSGQTWQKINADTSNTFFKIYLLRNTSVGFIVGSNGTILKSIDEGNSWFNESSPTNEILFGISFSDSNNGVIVGWDGTILKSTNQGQTWNKENKFTDKYLRDIYFADDKTGIIVGGSGEILRTENGGNDWEKINSNSYSGLYSVIFINNKRGFVLGSKGEILVSSNGGKNWKSSSSGSYASLISISESTAGKIYIVSNNGSIITN
ncbi:MAG: protein kinase [Bacteroidetes bacterium]|nr:protein kinase [Bacteroidota bacterium]